MTTTIAVCTMLVGGWVLPDVATTPGGSVATPGVNLPSVPNSVGGGVNGAPQQSAGAGQADGYAQPGGMMGPGRSHMAAPGAASAARQYLPPMPTDPNAEVPTFGTPTPVPQARGRSAAGLSRYQPRSPETRRRSGLSPTSGAERGRVNHRRPANPFGTDSGYRNSVGGGSAAIDQKPFAGYRPPPAVSPYLNLYRTDSSDDFDNYNTLVRPFVEQRRFNNRIRQEVQGLDRMSQQQQRALQQIDRQNQVFQGTTDPRFFQDTGGFYQNR